MKKHSDIYNPTPKMEALINNFYSVFQARGASTRISKKEAEIRGVHANIEIVRGYMPHLNRANEARANATIAHLYGVIEYMGKEMDVMMKKPKRRVKR